MRRDPVVPRLLKEIPGPTSSRGEVSGFLRPPSFTCPALCGSSLDVSCPLGGPDGWQSCGRKPKVILPFVLLTFSVSPRPLTRSLSETEGVTDKRSRTGQPWGANKYPPTVVSVFRWTRSGTYLFPALYWDEVGVSGHESEVGRPPGVRPLTRTQRFWLCLYGSM